MSTSVRVLVAVLIALSLGTSAYFGYTYFAQSRTLPPAASQTAAGSNQTLQPVNIDGSQAADYQGQIFCIKDTKKGASLSACESFGIIMSDDTPYELILDSGVDATGYKEMEKVKVSGVLSPEKSSLGPDGVLIVFKISK